MAEDLIYRDLAIAMFTGFAITFTVGVVVDVKTRLKKGEKLTAILRSYL